MTKIGPLCPSHPWITFSVEMRRASPALWLLLGEAKSKCYHLAGVPLSTPVARELHFVFLAKGVHATTAIEGNALTEEQVLRIVRENRDPKEAKTYAEREIANILGAVNEILDYVEKDGVADISETDVKAYNQKILDGLPVADHVSPGEYSKVQVGVPGYRGAPVDMLDRLMEYLCYWLNGPTFKAPEGELIVYGLVKAVVAHLYLVWIHPFGDGNGRTARLIEARVLLEAGVPSAACHLLSNHYNRTRPQYYLELDKASKSGGDILPFMQYAVNGFVEQLREQIAVVKNQQWSVSWINYVHDRFKGKLSKAEKRQRDLVLALTEADRDVATDEARHLSPMVAEEYANLTDRTVYRDLESLRKKRLVVKEGDVYRANKGLILHFLPRTRKGDLEAQLAQANKILLSGQSDDIEDANQAEMFDK